METKGMIDKIKELVKKGNVSKIVVRHNGDVIVSIPVSVGVVGMVVGLSAAKWAILAAALATVGFGCSVEIVKDDGGIVNVVSEEDTQKAKDAAANIVTEVKDAAASFVGQARESVQDVDFEQVVDDSEPKE